MDGRANPLVDRKVVGVSGNLSIYLFIYLSVCLYLSIYPSIFLSLSICLFIYLSIYLSACLSVCLSIQLSFYLSICLFVYLSICLSVCLSICFTIYLSTCKLKNEVISARLPQFSKLTASKTKQFSETSFKNGRLSAELTASCQCSLRFFHSPCLKYCACHEKVMPGHAKCCTCHAESS